MIEIDEIELAQVLQEVIDTFLIPHFMALGMNATGDWVNALEVRVNNGTGEIWGLDYTQYLVNGREPGGRPPVDNLVRWAQAKFGASGDEARRIAWAVSTKIAKEGTDYYPQGTDLLEVLRSPEVTNYVNSRLSVMISGKIQETIVRNLKKTFNG